jgi:hypothetical protein
MADQREQETVRRVMELLALECDLEAAIGAQRQAVRVYPEASAAVERFHQMIKEHRDALRSYLEDRGEGADPTASAVRVFVGDEQHAHAVSDTLRNDYTAFTYAAISYAMLVELAFRVYDPALRALAPKHLNGYAEAAQTINHLIVNTVADELASVGLECHCVCPMCSMGACGWVSLGNAMLNGRGAKRHKPVRQNLGSRSSHRVAEAHSLSPGFNDVTACSKWTVSTSTPSARSRPRFASIRSATTCSSCCSVVRPRHGMSGSSTSAITNRRSHRAHTHVQIDPQRPSTYSDQQEQEE